MRVHSHGWMVWATLCMDEGEGMVKLRVWAWNTVHGHVQLWMKW